MSPRNLTNQQSMQPNLSLRFATNLGENQVCTGVPEEYDVLCGRDKAAFEWKGNKEFRKMIWETLPRYKMADSRFKRGQVVKTVVEEIFGSGRRFLKKNQKTDLWFEIGFDKAREKTAHAFRDAITADRRRIHPKGYRGSQRKKKTSRRSKTGRRKDESNPIHTSHVAGPADRLERSIPTPQENEVSKQCRGCYFPTNPSTEWHPRIVRDRMNWCASMKHLDEGRSHDMRGEEDFVAAASHDPRNRTETLNTFFEEIDIDPTDEELAWLDQPPVWREGGVVSL